MNRKVEVDEQKLRNSLLALGFDSMCCDGILEILPKDQKGYFARICLCAGVFIEIEYEWFLK